MYKKIRFGRIFVRVQYIVDPHNQNLVRVRTPGPSQDRRHWSKRSESLVGMNQSSKQTLYTAVTFASWRTRQVRNVKVHFHSAKINAWQFLLFVIFHPMIWRPRLNSLKLINLANNSISCCQLNGKIQLENCYCTDSVYYIPIFLQSIMSFDGSVPS